MEAYSLLGVDNKYIFFEILNFRRESKIKKTKLGILEYKIMTALVEVPHNS